MQIHDVVIIGAGPAGLMAARELEKNKVNYLVIEAKGKIGSPLKCGEITRKDTFLELFDCTDYPFIKNNISKISFQIKQTRKVVKKNMVMLDKPEFLRWLAQPIEDNLMLNAKSEDISQMIDGLRISTNDDTFHAKLAILANGANYKVQKTFALVKKKVELVPCIGGLFKTTALDRDTAYFFYDEDRYLASWVFPKEDNIFNAGTGIILKNRNADEKSLPKSFRQFMQKYEITLQGEISYAGHYVTNGPIHRTYADRLLVCGDAAGQIYAGIGEGIYFSLKAGQLAGQTAIKALNNDTFNSDFLKEYEVHWKKLFRRQMDAGFVFATILFFFKFKNRLPRIWNELKYLFG